MKRFWAILGICMALTWGLFQVGAVEQQGWDPEQMMEKVLEQQLEQLDMGQFDQYLQQETSLLLGQRNSNTLLKDILQGKLWQDGPGLWQNLWEWIRQQMMGGLQGVAQIFAIILIGGLLNALCPLEDDRSKKLASMICGLCCVLAAMQNFTGMAQQGVEAVEHITDLVRVLIPVMAGVLLWGGRALSATSMPVLVLGLCAVLNEIIKAVFLPLIYGYIAISCAAAAFEDKRFTGLADMLRSMVQWGLGLSFTIFAGIMSLQASSLRIADSTVTRTVKFAVGSFVPVVGKVLSDVSDIVLGCGGMISSGLGIFGIVACIVICGVPVLRALLYSLLYRLLAAVGQMSGSESLCRVLRSFSDAFMLLLAMSAAVSVLFIIAFAMVAGGGK